VLLRVLVSTAQTDLRDRLVRILGRLELVEPAGTDPEGLWARLDSGDVDMILMDRWGLAPRPGEALAAMRRLPEQPEVVIVTENEDRDERAAFLAAGCMAVLNAGLDDARMGEALRALVQRRRRESQRQMRSDRVRQPPSLQDFISESPAMQQFMNIARRVVQSDSSLLLLGETGVGKERLARAIHQEGPRGAGQFLAVNCAALPETLLESELFGHEKGAFTGATRSRRGYFEMAHGGTLFLDEIGDLPQHLQVKLLRVLEERVVQRLGSEATVPIDVRLMAATNRDLEDEMAAGRFRSDLYYRLAVVSLRLPPLRERREDVPGLAHSYLEHFNMSLGRRIEGFEPGAKEALVRYDWPGNVRELINVIERTALLSTQALIRAEDLPAGIQLVASGVPTGDGGVREGVGDGPASRSWRGRPLREVEREVLASLRRDYLAQVLGEAGGRIGEAARLAGLNPRTLYAMMRRHGLRKEDFRPRGGADGNRN